MNKNNKTIHNQLRYIDGSRNNHNDRTTFSPQLVSTHPSVKRDTCGLLIAASAVALGFSQGTVAQENGFTISLDGDVVAGDKPEVSSDVGQSNDLKSASVQVKFDGLDISPRLNVTTRDLRSSFKGGDTVTFETSSNYPAFIEKAEVLIVARYRGTTKEVSRLPVSVNHAVQWTMPESGPDQFDYILRVYDTKGRYNETVPLTLHRTTREFKTHRTTNGPVSAAGDGEDRTALANIGVRGGSVTASGQGVAEGRTVTIMGENVAVDASGNFVFQRIMLPGVHAVDVEISSEGEEPERVVHEVEIPKNDWFFVGIADVTLGAQIKDGLEEASGEFDRFYADGQTGYYLKGKVKGKYLITSSVHTDDGPITDIFNRINEKDPRWILEQLDPDDYYPVYGDDSTAIDDTPSSRRFYVRVERDQNYALFGDFDANFNETEYLRNNRELYGGRVRLVSPKAAENGENRYQLDLYASSPETLPQRDVLQGTGGSTYFLSRQGIRAASETLYIETREAETDRVLGRTTLVEGQDYEIDYLQGVVILSQPLGSSSSTSNVVRDAVLGENQAFLIVQYEYAPVIGDVSGTSYGGRAEVQLTDQLRLGVTAMRENTGLADQKMVGADLELRLGKNSYLEAEFARSSGPGFGQAFSSDGGLLISSEPSSGLIDNRAFAARFAGKLDVQDFGLKRPGEVGFYVEYEEGGFSSFSENITANQFLYGVYGKFDLTDKVKLSFEAEDFKSDAGRENSEAHVDLSYQLSKSWAISAGVAYENKQDQREDGERVDAGLRLSYAPSDDLTLYSFAQTTLSRSGTISDNDRIGAGAEYQITEKTHLAGEVSGGDQGVGVIGKLGYKPTADNEVYLGYIRDPTDRGSNSFFSDTASILTDDRQKGKVVVGSKFRHNEKLTTYGENVYDIFGDRDALTSTYGVKYTPNSKWSFAGGVEFGKIKDDINGDFDRRAGSFGVGYTRDDKVRARSKLELRDENGVGLTRDRFTIAFSGGYEHKVSEDWRFLSNVEGLISDSDESSFRDGDYVEASVGYAYRPVSNDRLNALFRYTYLRDLPGVNQVTVNGTTEGPQQKSHIVSADVNYDVFKRLTLGAKYGFRKSQLTDRDSGEQSHSTAHLGIARLDWHFVHKWDLIAQAHALFTMETNTWETGFLAEIDRHVGKNLKVGIGYKFGSITTDLSDLDFDESGVFFNITGKF